MGKLGLKLAWNKHRKNPMEMQIVKTMHSRLYNILIIYIYVVRAVYRAKLQLIALQHFAKITLHKMSIVHCALFLGVQCSGSEKSKIARINISKRSKRGYVGIGIENLKTGIDN